MGGPLQKIAAACALASAFAGTAFAHDPDGLINRAASAGPTAKNAGWTASLFVTKPTVERDAAALALGSSVGARLSRPLTRHSRLTVDVFDQLARPSATPDDFAAMHAIPRANLADDFFHPADGRGIRLGLKITF